MDRTKDDSFQPAGILIFDLKCQLLYSNYEGRHLYLGKNERVAQLAEDDVCFDIKRLCFRLKKLSDSQSSHSEQAIPAKHDRAAPIVVTSRDRRYRLHGFLINDEVSRGPHIFIQVETEEHKGSSKLNLAHYQSAYQLTQRESQILELLSKGASYKEIGYALMISAHTVRDHIKNIRFKLRVDGKCGILARLIEEAGVAQDIALSTVAERKPESSFSHVVHSKSSAPVIKAHSTATSKAIFATVDQTRAASKQRSDAAAPSVRTETVRASHGPQVRHAKPWPLPAKR